MHLQQKVVIVTGGGAGIGGAVGVGLEAGGAAFVRSLEANRALP